MGKGKDEPVATLMALAVPKPARVIASRVDGGPVLALALHCVMVREGFSVVEEQGVRSKHVSSYVPPARWNGALPDQWVFTYTKDGKANRFVLHCSLQVATGRMFVHASEEGNPANIQVLGLQLQNYVPDPAACARTADWSSALANEAKMELMFLEHIVRPLSEAAEEVPLTPLGSTGSGARSGSRRFANGNTHSGQGSMRAADSSEEELDGVPGGVDHPRASHQQGQQQTLLARRASRQRSQRNRREQQQHGDYDDEDDDGEEEAEAARLLLLQRYSAVTEAMRGYVIGAAVGALLVAGVMAFASVRAGGGGRLSS